jgi:predicted kinase
MTRPTRCYPGELASIPTHAVVVMIGAAGAGKSTLAQCLATRWDHHAVLSTNACRAQITGGDPFNWDATPDAVLLLHKLLSHRCLAGLTTVVDGTNVTVDRREPLVNAAASVGLPAVAVVLNTPLEVCLARQRDRPGPLPGRKWGPRIPDGVVAAQHAAVLASIPGLPTESFSSVFVINPEGT